MFGKKRQNSAVMLHLKSSVFKQVSCFCVGSFYCLFGSTVVQAVKIKFLLIYHTEKYETGESYKDSFSHTIACQRTTVLCKVKLLSAYRVFGQRG